MLHIAVVHAGDEICHVTADVSAQGLADRLGRYVRDQVGYQLDSRAAARVLELLAEGRSREAVELYFRRAGRWAPERLVTRRIPFPDDTLRSVRATASEP